MKSKAHTAPVSIAPPTDQERADMARPATNGINGHDVKVKVEDKMDEGQLTRLATGVTVDTGGAPLSASAVRLIGRRCRTCVPSDQINQRVPSPVLQDP